MSGLFVGANCTGRGFEVTNHINVRTAGNPDNFELMKIVSSVPMELIQCLKEVGTGLMLPYL